VARDRKRTRPRSSEGAAEPADAGAPPYSPVPASVQHTGEVDEFDAELVRGADVAGELVDGEVAVDEAELVKESEEAAAAFGGDSGGGRERRPVARDGRAPEPTHKRSLFSRAIAFLQASWAELQRVQWPDRRQVAQATAVVLGFVAVAGVYLGAADWLAQKVVNFIL
jgi:preprotein translocase SecE subunit